MNERKKEKQQTQNINQDQKRNLPPPRPRPHQLYVAAAEHRKERTTKGTVHASEQSLENIVWGLHWFYWHQTITLRSDVVNSSKSYSAHMKVNSCSESKKKKTTKKKKKKKTKKKKKKNTHTQNKPPKNM